RKKEVKERYRTDDVLTSDEKAEYYSSWIYAACHAGVTVSNCNTQNRLSQLLQIPEAVTAKALQFLTKTKLLNERTDGTFEIGTTKMHLGSDSPLVAKHHAN